jgi:hypothetical protein
MRRLALFVQLIFAAVTSLCAPQRGSAQTIGATSPAPWGLFSARYDSRSADFIYAVYGYGHTFAMVGALQNPRSGFTELLGALGRTFAPGGGPTQSMAVGAARSDSVWYAQLYVLPSVTIGLVALRATTELDVPVSRGGVLQFGVSPLSLTTGIAARTELGLALDLAAADGQTTTSALGPELRLTLPGAVLGVDLQRTLGGHAGRVRLFFMTQF